MSKTWLLLAHPREIHGLADWLRTRPDLRLVVTGVGLLESQYRFARELLLAEKKPERVLQIGTAGYLDHGKVFDCQFSNRFSMPFSAQEEIPEFLKPIWSTQPWDGQPLSPESPILYSTFGITLNPDPLEKAVDAYRRKQKLESASFWENMEAASLSYLAHRENIPFSSLSCTTNRVGPSGRSDWWKNYERAGTLLFEKVTKIFEG